MKECYASATYQPVIIYTDGACCANGQPHSMGGWACLLIYGTKRMELSGREAPSTNQRMEIMAAIAALEALKRPCNVVLTTDSEYLRKGITLWVSKWKQKNWVTSKKQPVANKDLWVRLDAATEGHKIEWKWTKGHAENELNNHCDELAQKAVWG